MTSAMGFVIAVLFLTSSLLAALSVENDADNSISQQGNEEGSSFPKDSKNLNWLQTRKWLIESVGRLSHELNELARDYSEHVEAEKVLSDKQQQQLNRDIASLRADHSVMYKSMEDSNEELVQLVKNVFHYIKHCHKRHHQVRYQHRHRHKRECIIDGIKEHLKFAIA